MMKPQIGVIGSGICNNGISNPSICDLAKEVGKHIAKNGAILICGGRGGVMEAAAFGAKESGGITVGILPGEHHSDANPYIDIAITTAMGHARNTIIAQSSSVLIAVGGRYGTLSEIALALSMEKPVVVIASKWEIDGVYIAKTPKDAVDIALKFI